MVVAHEEEMSPAQREEFDRQKKVLSNMGKLLRNYTESESTVRYVPTLFFCVPYTYLCEMHTRR